MLRRLIQPTRDSEPVIKPVARSPAWYRARAKLLTGNVRSAKICASTSKGQRRQEGEESKRRGLLMLN
jgi:hypothetical protein